jgi:hypothetical protein
VVCQPGESYVLAGNVVDCLRGSFSVGRLRHGVGGDVILACRKDGAFGLCLWFTLSPGTFFREA